jgi:hypothetical protein
MAHLARTFIATVSTFFHSTQTFFSHRTMVYKVPLPQTITENTSTTRQVLPSIFRPTPTRAHQILLLLGGKNMRLRGDSHDTVLSGCSSSTSTTGIVVLHLTTSPTKQQPDAADMPFRRLAFETFLCLAMWCVVVSMFVASDSTTAAGRTLQAPLLRSPVEVGGASRGSSSNNYNNNHHGIISTATTTTTPLRYLVDHRPVGATGAASASSVGQRAPFGRREINNNSNSKKSSKDTVRRILRFLNDNENEGNH